MQQFLPVNIIGHAKIVDDLGQVHLDKYNAVHPQNLAKIIARGLSNEANNFIHRIAYGNGGTEVDAAFTITYKTPNDGQNPDSRTWDSRLYNETYSEIVNEGTTGAPNASLGTDPGTAGPNVGTRPGGGAVPSSDPSSTPHVSGPGVFSNELGLTSEVVIVSVLNANEPAGQLSTDNNTDTEGSFVFDEIGLYTTGGPAINKSGSQDIDVGDRTSSDDTGLAANTPYDFYITIDGGSAQHISFTTPAAGGSGASNEILYSDLIDALMTNEVTWNMFLNGGSFGSGLPGIGASASITGYGSPDTQTFGFLRFYSNSTGDGSTIALAAGDDGPGTDMIAAFFPTSGIIMTADPGQNSGVQNNPTDPDTERERLLTHLIFSPVLKSKNRVLTITYTLTVSVARTI